MLRRDLAKGPSLADWCLSRGDMEEGSGVSLSFVSRLDKGVGESIDNAWHFCW
jgi:hypothetical protein